MNNFWSQPRGYSRPALLCGSLLLVALFASGCDLDRMGYGPPDPSVSAVPGFICPGETTTVSWDAGRNVDGCHDPNEITGSGLLSTGTDYCKSVTFTNDGGLPNEPPVRETENTGSRTFAPTRTTMFTMNATWRGRDWTHEGSAAVTVIDTGGGYQNFVFAGRCSGANPVWDELALKEMLSGCVGVTGVCNTSGEWLTISNESGLRETVLPGHCTTAFNGQGDTLTATPSNYVPSGDMCGSTSTSGEPPDLEIQVNVACDMGLQNCAIETTSAPLMSEPGRPSGDEPATICNVEQTCGDGVCDAPCEDATSCAADCAPVTLDLPPPQPPPPSGDIALPGSDGSLCGDGVCQAGESPDWCGDCVPEEGGDGGPPPPPPPAPVCGDGVCDPSEVGCGVCSTDCGPC